MARTLGLFKSNEISVLVSAVDHGVSQRLVKLLRRDEWKREFVLLSIIASIKNHVYCLFVVDHVVVVLWV